MAESLAGAAESMPRVEEFLFLTLMPSYTVVGNGLYGDRIKGPDCEDRCTTFTPTRFSATACCLPSS